MDAVRIHLSRLLDFHGRENRARFWLWFAICYGFQTMLSMLAMIPFLFWMYSHFQMAFARNARGLPPTSPDKMLGEMQPMMLGIGVFGAVTGAIFAILLASAIVRRLHDRNISGWWALPVLLFNIASQVSSVSMIASQKLALDPGNPYGNLAQSFGLLQFLSFGTLIVLIVFLALKGTQGPNRHGPDPLFEL